MSDGVNAESIIILLEQHVIHTIFCFKKDVLFEIEDGCRQIV